MCVVGCKSVARSRLRLLQRFPRLSRLNMKMSFCGWMLTRMPLYGRGHDSANAARGQRNNISDSRGSCIIVKSIIKRHKIAFVDKKQPRGGDLFLVCLEMQANISILKKKKKLERCSQSSWKNILNIICRLILKEFKSVTHELSALNARRQDYLPLS